MKNQYFSQVEMKFLNLPNQILVIFHLHLDTLQLDLVQFNKRYQKDLEKKNCSMTLQLILI